MYQGSSDLRSANENIPYSPDMLNEFLKCSQDAIYFAETYFTIIHPDRGRELIKLYDFQKKMLKAYITPPMGKKHLIVRIPRQSGKCFSHPVNVKIKNKKTGEIKELPIIDFYNMIKNTNKVLKNIDKKFVCSFNVDEWKIETEDGWKDIIYIHKTIEYEVYELKTKSFSLRCADDHIVMVDGFVEKFVKDLTIYDKVITVNGLESVVSVEKLNLPPENMYDVTVDSKTHTLYTNGILSHNTTLTTVFLL
jgi:hypothetical protein